MKIGIVSVFSFIQNIFFLFSQIPWNDVNLNNPTKIKLLVDTPQAEVGRFE